MYAVVTTAGNGVQGQRDGIAEEAQFNQPLEITISNDGKNLYVLDFQSSCVRKVSLVDGNTSTIAGISGIANNIVSFPLLSRKKPFSLYI